MIDQVYYWVGVAVVWGNITVLAMLLGLTLLGKRWYVLRWRLGRYWRRPAAAALPASPPPKHYWRRGARRLRPALPARPTEA